jgi:hypothetical protein
VKGGLATTPGEVNVRFIALLSLSDRTQGQFVEESRSSHLNFHLDLAARGASMRIYATKNCARCYGTLALTSGKVNVRFIALLSPLARTEGPVCGEKAVQVT